MIKFGRKRRVGRPEEGLEGDDRVVGGECIAFDKERAVEWVETVGLDAQDAHRSMSGRCRPAPPRPTTHRTPAEPSRASKTPASKISI